MYRLASLICSLSLFSSAAFADYSQHEEAKKFIAEMVQEHQFTEAELTAWLKSAEKRQPILDAISRPAEKAKPWRDYRPIFIQPQRVTSGVAFWKQHADALARAEKQFGVEQEIIVAIIGVETGYGRNMGSHRVIDALSTLAFDYPPRSPFFRSELKNYFLLTREQQKDPLAFKGSYAGAMGYGQFMPSSYRNWAVDFDGDGFVDIWNNPIDAIGSVANYFKAHGWRHKNAVVLAAEFTGDRSASEIVFNQIQPPTITYREWKKSGLKAKVKTSSSLPLTAIEFDGVKGLEYWLGLHNFYVITRYNRSPMYAMAVYQLSQEIRSAKYAAPKKQQANLSP
jgi:membrane-bound lytic murein transglycosylase B